ncbi:hypothetical protein ALQ16_202096 [Pseudomonas syringae pv. actinidiae]|nr:hypothetical protein ALQ16_202096 [Pseudomonas syringae pv. actinidiae]RMS14745.1 hypothetical protein ALP75_203194 [Pseudomonas syringae pv. actinidiae]RMS58914.1 hypothetical protein ALP64_204156 [Pseudomonas syringae pv. actinidiae]
MSLALTVFNQRVNTAVVPVDESGNAVVATEGHACQLKVCLLGHQLQFRLIALECATVCTVKSALSVSDKQLVATQTDRRRLRLATVELKAFGFFRRQPANYRAHVSQQDRLGLFAAEQRCSIVRRDRK